MSSYNRINGEFVGDKKEYLTEILREEYTSDGNMEKECEKVLQQIIGVRYTESLEQEEIHKIIKYGIVCYKKKCKVVMRIEE